MLWKIISVIALVGLIWAMAFRAGRRSLTRPRPPAPETEASPTNITADEMIKCVHCGTYNIKGKPCDCQRS